ncbi:alpha/beta hydrolase-fold protein [soil metagenome]
MMTKLLFFVLFIFSATNFAQKPERVTGEEITGMLFRYKNFNSTFVETRNVDVWLPANYSKNKKYAVLYFHDGQNLFNPKDTYGGVDWNIDATLQRLMTEKKVRDTIVVGIWNTAKRTIEYSPQKAYDLVNHKGVKKSKYVTRQEGLSDKYLKFIVSELKPFIDKTYSTKPDRDNTFIMGSSMGGLMSLYAISEYPQIFGGAGCVSTHFPLGEGVMIEYMKEKLPSPKNHKIYFDYGTETLDATYEPFQKKADKVMKKKGYKKGRNWLTRKFEGEEHSEKSWRKRVDIPLEFLLGK